MLVFNPKIMKRTGLKAGKKVVVTVMAGRIVITPYFSGPRDGSTNKRYLEEAILADATRSSWRKRRAK